MRTCSLLASLLICSGAVLHAGITPEELLRQTVRNKIRISPEKVMERYLSSLPAPPPSSSGQGQQRIANAVQTDETVVSDDTEVESEVHAAVNPVDTANIIISPIRQAGSFPAVDLTCPVYYTKDFGKTWKKVISAPCPGSRMRCW